jgi:hypothetical protein
MFHFIFFDENGAKKHTEKITLTSRSEVKKWGGYSAGFCVAISPRPVSLLLYLNAIVLSRNLKPKTDRGRPASERANSQRAPASWASSQAARRRPAARAACDEPTHSGFFDVSALFTASRV